MIIKMKRPLQFWIQFGYNPIHLFKDYYLLRRYPKHIKKFSLYTVRKIKE